MTWPPSLAAFKVMVAEEWGLDPEQLVSKVRIRSLVHPRQAAMYLARQVGQYPLTEIGEAFGGRDHSTVNHAIRVVELRLRLDRDFKAKVDVVLDHLTEIRHKNIHISTNGSVETPGKENPQSLPHGFHRLSHIERVADLIRRNEVSLPRHIPTASTASTMSLNRVLEAIDSIPDREAREQLSRAWELYLRLAHIIPEVYP